MATSNKAISAYIPPDLEEYLTEYCTEYDITRKDKSGEIKPALGTAVVEILKVFFSSGNVQPPLPNKVSLLPCNVVTEERLNEALSQLQSDSNVSSNLQSKAITQDDLNKALDTIPSTVNQEVDKAIASLESSLREELAPILQAKQEMKELLTKPSA